MSDNLGQEYDEYEALFHESNRERTRGRKRTKKRGTEQAAQLTEPSGAEAGIMMTYQPARFEGGWLRDSLGSFYEQHLITDVLANVKGGKEASVYCCAADPTTGETLLAAKVYRPRQFRNLRNDKMYRDGREILTADGNAAKKTDHRLMRAIGKKTAFGVQVAHTSWLMHEFKTLERLHKLGAAVPRPFGVNDNTLLMSYCGDASAAAPTLNGVRLARDEAEPLFREVLRNIELMLAHGLIHGDLSAYNMLLWQGRVTLIDFPQITHSASNPHAQAIFTRDVTRVCDYFNQQGVRANSKALAHDIWQRYVDVDADEA